MIEFEVTESKEQPDCKGQIFRADVSQYWNGEDFGSRIRMRRLKRKSCPGCQNCDYLLEYLDEFCSEQSVILPDNPKHGALYELICTITGHDFETGYPDDFELSFEKVKE